MKITGLSHCFLGLYCVSEPIKELKLVISSQEQLYSYFLFLFIFNEKQKPSQNTPGSGMNMKLAGRPSV